MMVKKKSPEGTLLDIHWRYLSVLKPIFLRVLLFAAVLCSSATTASASWHPPQLPVQRGAVTDSDSDSARARDSDSIVELMFRHNVHDWLPGRHARGWEPGAPLAALKAALRWKESLKISSKPTVTWNSSEPSKSTLHRSFGDQRKPGWIQHDQCK